MVKRSEGLKSQARATDYHMAIDLMGRRILVTGGAGFIGRHLSDFLLESGARVRVIDDLSTGRRDLLDPRIDLRIGGIESSNARRDALQGVDAVIHLAAITSVPRCAENPSRNELVNHSAARDLFEEASQASMPVVHASTAAIYGPPIEVPILESHPIEPISAYGKAKRAAERDLLSSAAAVCSLRLFNVYGPGQPADSPYSGVLTIFTRRIANGASLTIHGDGGQTRDFVHVRDVSVAFGKVIADLLAKGVESAASHRALNVCTGQARTLNEIVATLRNLSSTPLAIEHGPPRSADIRYSVGVQTALERAVGWTPEVPFDAGLKELLRLANNRE